MESGANAAGPDAFDTGTWSWRRELTKADVRQIVPTGYGLLTNGSKWVNRRVETLQLVDEGTIREQLSVDFRLPVDLPGALDLGARRTFFLPLTFMQRRSDLAYFDCWDEAGQGVPVLTYNENAFLTGMYLMMAVNAILKARNASLPAGDAQLEMNETLRAVLALAATKGAKQAEFYAKDILNPTNATIYPDRRVADAILEDRDFVELLATCCVCSVIHVPLEVEPGARRILKLAWEQPWGPWTERRPGGKRGKLWQTVARELGWKPHVRIHPVPEVGSAQSHHLQVAVPADVEITSASLKSFSPFIVVRHLAHEEAPRVEPSRTSTTFVAGIARSVHLYVPNSHPHRTAGLSVAMRAARHAFVVPAFVASLLVSAVLIVYATRADQIMAREETAGAVLLVVPALLLGFLVRPGEHDMARRLLRWPRFLTAFHGVLPLVAAGFLVAAPDAQQPLGDRLGSFIRGAGPTAPDTVVCAWTILAALSVLLTLIAFVTAVRPRARARTGHPDERSHAERFAAAEVPEHDGEPQAGV